MYLPKHFEADEIIGREIMAAHSWALLTTAAEDGAPLTTHLSLLWQAAGGPHGSLIGHVARANPHWKLFARRPESLALFWGPHAYVSPTWYTPGAKVPTWNYVTVHAYGRPEIVEDTQGALDVLSALAHAGQESAGCSHGGCIATEGWACAYVDPKGVHPGEDVDLLVDGRRPYRGGLEPVAQRLVIQHGDRQRFAGSVVIPVVRQRMRRDCQIVTCAAKKTSSSAAAAAVAVQNARVTAGRIQSSMRAYEPGPFAAINADAM